MSWHVTGDRSNAGAAGAPGAQDEVFMAAHDAVQAQRDSQGRLILASLHATPPTATIDTKNLTTTKIIKIKTKSLNFDIKLESCKNKK